MPKEIDPELKARAVRLVSEHAGQYQNVTAASVAVAKQVGVSRESVRRGGRSGPGRCRDPARLDERGVRRGAPVEGGEQAVA